MSQSTKNLVMFTVVLISLTFNTLVFGMGLGKTYLANGNVTVTVTKNPHQFSGDWGIVDPYTGKDISIGTTDEVGISRYLGSYDNQELVLWADGKTKRFYTGQGNGSTVDNEFVINGVKFEINSAAEAKLIESDSSISMSALVPEPLSDYAEVLSFNEDVNDCSDPDIEYIPVKMVDLQARWSSILNTSIVRIQMTGNQIDHTLYKDGEMTVEVTLNDRCDHTYNLTDEVNRFVDLKKNFMGVRLTEYDYPEGDSTYAGKMRVTNERGINKHYIYLNNCDTFDLVGSTVNVKVRIYQNGNLIQAFEGNRIMAEVIN